MRLQLYICFEAFCICMCWALCACVGVGVCKCGLALASLDSLWIDLLDRRF